jgi:hypothetical protein
MGIFFSKFPSQFPKEFSSKAVVKNLTSSASQNFQHTPHPSLSISQSGMLKFSTSSREEAGPQHSKALPNTVQLSEGFSNIPCILLGK